MAATFIPDDDGVQRMETQPNFKAETGLTVRARTMGLRPGLSIECVAGLIEAVEGPLHR